MSDLVARLIAAGTDPMLVAEVAMELGRLTGMIEASEKPDTMAENRRAWDRERRRKERAEAKGVGLSTGHPPESADKADAPPSLDKEKCPKEINPTPAHTHTRPARAAPWPCPDAVEPEHWADFLANRKRKKLANSNTAHEGVLADIARLADAHWPPGALVQHAAAKGWGSINYPSDGPAHDRRNGHHSADRNGNRPTSGHGRTIDAMQLALDRASAPH